MRCVACQGMAVGSMLTSPGFAESKTVQSFVVRTAVKRKGVTYHWWFACSGFDEAVEQVINLVGIDRKEGEAGMKFLG